MKRIILSSFLGLAFTAMTFAQEEQVETTAEEIIEINEQAAKAAEKATKEAEKVARKSEYQLKLEEKRGETHHESPKKAKQIGAFYYEVGKHH